MCFVATNLVTSLEFKPIRCATTLCHFGGTRNGYVATRFILLSSTAESSATSSYVVIPERFSQSEEQASRNEKLVLFCNTGFNRCNLKTYVNRTLPIIYMYYILFDLFIFVHFLNNFILWKTFLIICLRFVFIVLVREEPLWYPCLRVWTRTFFCRKLEKMRSMKEEVDGQEFISRQSQQYYFIDIMTNVFFPICTLNWRVNNYVSRQGKGIKRRIESTKIIIKIRSLLILYSSSEIINRSLPLKTLFPQNRGHRHFCYNLEIGAVFKTDRAFLSESW